MKRFSVFLVFLTVWMSTWMVTDIHDLSIADQIHSDQYAGFNIESHIDTIDEHDHNSHCGVCSYDHGGHIGQILATLPFVAEHVPSQNIIHSFLDLGFWSSQNTAPIPPPPIA